MKKNVFIWGLILVILFGLTACKENDKEQSDALKFKEEYEGLNNTTREKDGKTIRSLDIVEDNPFIYKEPKDILEMMEVGDTFVVYFGFPDCPWCRSAIPTLIDVAKDLELSQVYYVNVKEIRDTMVIDDSGAVVTETEGTTEYYQLLEKLDTVLDFYTLKDKDGNEVNTGERRIFAPSIISVVEGKAVEITDGISEKQTDGYMELSQEMQEESYDKIKCSIQCVANQKAVCSSKTTC